MGGKLQKLAKLFFQIESPWLLLRIIQNMRVGILVQCYYWLVLLVPAVYALEFDMMFQTKCIMEEINENVLVVGDYKAFDKNNYNLPVNIDAKVDNPKGFALYNQKNQDAGQFVFTTEMSGDYKACFSVKTLNTAQNTRIRLDWKTGVAAKDWDTIAKKENLNAMATELRKLEEIVKEIHTEMLELRKREEEMRAMNEATNSRVAYYSGLSVMICVGLAGWQLWYLKKFFQRKKLL
eukprot:TRINITY_DN2048_c0_g1_i1.p3 TRINITY_DN2048_c0_g1~~TRINITY_DN2048_c0_g1_i1.p3  ORF type:complete len:236 (-),score=46.28 TRINITY_DN2048_c0_g1_i1:180-887(-)